MSTPVTIALQSEGAAQVLAALHGVKAALVDIEKHSAVLVKVSAPAPAAGSAKADAAARVAGLRAEIKVTEELARARASAGGSSGGQGRGSDGRFGAGGGSSASAGGRDQGALFQVGAAMVFLKSGIDLAAASLKQFSGFLINDVIRPSMAMTTKAVQIANSSGGKLSAADVESKARAVGVRNNVDPMAVIEGAGIFQDATGESKLGFDMMGTISALSKSRGFDMKEMTGLAGALYKPGMDKGELDQLLLAQTAQGDMGSITLGQMAKLGGKLTAPAGNFAGDYGTRIAMSGALLQSGRKGFGSVDEAASGLASFVTDSMKAGKAFSPRSMTKGADGVEKIADPAQLIGDIFRKTAGNSTKLTAAGYSEPAAKLIGSYKETYSEAFKASKDNGETDAQSKLDGAQAVENFIKSFVTASTTMESEEAKRDAVLATGGERFDAAVTRIKDTLLGIMPEVNAFVDVFAEHTPEIGGAAIILANVLIWMASVVVDIANGIAKVSGWFKNTGEGDVLKTVFDKGDKTKLPAMDEKGYWQKNAGLFEYIKGAEDKGVNDYANKGGVDKRTAAGVPYLDMNEDKGAPKKEPVTLELYGPRADAPEDAGGWQPGAPADAPAATAGVTKGAEEATAALASLTSTVKDMTSAMGELSRNASFGPAS